MFRALYFPHTVVRDTPEGNRLLKRALLMWDRLHYIVPYDGYVPTRISPLHKEAFDLIGKPHVPTKREQQLVHAEIEDLITRPNVPNLFSYTSMTDPDEYGIYTEKLLPETWQILTEGRAVGKLSEGRRLVREQAGLLIMAILADVCAGDACSRITDRTHSYETLVSLLTETGKDDTFANEYRDHVVTTTLSMLSVDNVSLEQLVAFRRKELGHHGYRIRELRHRYVSRIEEYLNKLRAKPEITREELSIKEDDFLAEMKDDLAAFEEELRIERTNTFFSKEFVVAMSAAIPAAAAAIAGVPLVLPAVLAGPASVVAVAGLLATRSKYQQARANLIRQHPMAYLYAVRGQHVW